MATQISLSNKIYVDGIREYLNETSLNKYFSKFGQVTNVTKMREIGEVIGYGFVEFQDYKIVDLILNTQNHLLDGSVLQLQKCYSDILNEAKLVKQTEKSVPYYDIDENIDSTRTDNLDATMNMEIDTSYGPDGPEDNSTPIIDSYKLHIDLNLKPNLSLYEDLLTKKAGLSANESDQINELIEAIKGNKCISIEKLHNLEKFSESLLFQQLAKEIEQNKSKTSNLSHQFKKIALSGLHSNVNSLLMKKYFDNFGNIIDLKESNSNSLSYSIITFDCEKSIDSIMKKGKHTIYGIEIKVERVLSSANVKLKRGQDEASCPMCLDSLNEV